MLYESTGSSLKHQLAPQLKVSLQYTTLYTTGCSVCRRAFVSLQLLVAVSIANCANSSFLQYASNDVGNHTLV